MPARPIITLTTDFGTADFYVAAMKAALLRECPDANLIDITHEIPRHDIVAGSFILERAVASFPPNTMHLAVVDPGVGSDRGLMIADIAGSSIVCPDNGLITWASRRHGVDRTFMIDWRPASFSSTFHGRDILAPITGRLARGLSPSELGRALNRPVLLDLHPAADGRAGAVLHIDHFGNATTNIPAEMVIHLQGSWHVGDHEIGPLRWTYADVGIGQPLALIGSSGLLEIAIRDGSAKKALEVHAGDTVICKTV